MFRRLAWLCVSIVCMGCGGTETAVGGGALVDVSGQCGVTGRACGADGDCCSGICDSVLRTCTSTVGRCVALGGRCSAGTDCCSFVCDNGVCSGVTCTPDNGACTSSATCCGGNCAGGKCQPLSGECRTSGNSCATSAECCSKLCKNGVCAIDSSFCTQNGDVCSNGRDCCGGICNIAAGATLGTCDTPTPGSTRCRGVDGTVCAGCGDCCSRVCVPYGTSGVSVCQRAGGCHIDGDICERDEDCCGNDKSVPTSGKTVQCVREKPSDPVGVCRNPMGCQPEGNVCHYKQDSNYACVVSSAPNDCCGAPGNSGACQLDPLGVPRCRAIGTCRPGGDTCAFSGDCCNNVPCVRDSTGQLRCAVAPDGGPPCIATGGSCTVNADCCAGNVCHIRAGSTSGTCAPPPPPPTGTVPDAGSCPVYGQVCTTSTPCCDRGVPCVGPTGALCDGQTLCHCRVPIK